MNRLTVELPFPANVVYAAFADPATVSRWLTSDSRVDLAGGVFELWGRHLPEAPTEPATRLLEARENESLRFAWRIRGGEGTVKVSFESAGGATKLAFHCDVPPFEPGMSGEYDFWGIAIENLRRTLAGGTAPVLPDFAGARPSGGAELSIDIEAPPEQVWGTLADPAQLDRYIAFNATVEPRAGGKYEFGWKGGGPRRILRIDPPKKLSYSWNYDHGDHAEPDTVVTWTLEGSGGRTRLTLVHNGFAKDRSSDDYRTGWLKYLNAIKSLAEMGAAWTRVKLEGPAGDW